MTKAHDFDFRKNDKSNVVRTSRDLQVIRFACLTGLKTRTTFLFEIIAIATFTAVPPHTLLGALTHRNDN
jgi:hypothetical protein